MDYISLFGGGDRWQYKGKQRPIGIVAGNVVPGNAIFQQTMDNIGTITPGQGASNTDLLNCHFLSIRRLNGAATFAYPILAFFKIWASVRALSFLENCLIM